MTRDEQFVVSQTPHSPGATTPSRFSRRNFLVGAAALSLTPILAGCTQARHNTVDPLYQLLFSAQQDVADAITVLSTHPSVKDLLTVRKGHVTALQAEIERQEKLWKTPEKRLPARTQAGVSVKELRQRQEKAAQEALNVVGESSGYRAGLAGSVAASCTALAKVVLA